MKILDRFQADNLLGVRFSVNVFVATVLLWILLRHLAGANPIWAIASMIAASEPVVKEAVRMFRSRLVNATVGCAIGLTVLVTGGSNEWKLPMAISIAVLVSSYFVKVQTMWRQAPITAAIIIASGIEQHSKLTGIEVGLRRVGEVLLGCLVGLTVSWLMSVLWPFRSVPAAATVR